MRLFGKKKRRIEELEAQLERRRVEAIPIHVKIAKVDWELNLEDCLLFPDPGVKFVPEDYRLTGVFRMVHGEGKPKPGDEEVVVECKGFWCCYKRIDPYAYTKF